MDTGCFISISFRQPHFRRHLYARSCYDWHVEDTTIGDSFQHYCYISTKGLSLAEEDIEEERKRNQPEDTLQVKCDNVLDCENNEDFLHNITL